MTGLTQQLAEFISTLEFSRLPGEALPIVRQGAIDCIGVMFAGRDEPVVRLVSGIVRMDAGQGEARLLFDRGQASAPHAALVNATAGHALDYDDTGLDGHPSVVLVPAVLAEGERVRVSGAELIAAYVAGYETWAELSFRDQDRHHEKGWHPSAVFGTVAAAAAAARLAHLDAGRATCALGIAASMASGLAGNFGTMTKPFQVGRAVQNGLTAARLAADGMTAAPDALEHRSGLLRAVSPAGRVRTDGDIAAGRDWHILRYGLHVKRYPVCYAVHRTIDAVLKLAAAHALVPAQVAEVEVCLGRAQVGMLRNPRPQTALDAKFSAQFAVASALVARQVGLAQLDDAFVASEPVQSLFSKVRITSIDAFDPDDPLFAPFDQVRIRLRDGTLLDSGPVRHARGHARNPLSETELAAKFEDCVGPALQPEARQKLLQRLLQLEALPEVAALYAV